MSTHGASEAVKRSKDFATMLNPADPSSWDALLNSPGSDTFLQDPKQFNKLMAYYSLADQQHDKDRLALVMTLLHMLSQKSGFKEMYDKIHFSTEAPTFLDMTKLKGKIAEAQTENLKSYLLARLSFDDRASPQASAQSNSNTSSVSYNVIDRSNQKREPSEQNNIMSPTLVAQSMITPRSSVQPSTQLSNEVNKKMAEYKQMIAEIKAEKEGVEADKVVDAVVEAAVEAAPIALTTTSTRAINRPTADLTGYNQMLEEDKLRIIAEDIMLKAGMTDSVIKELTSDKIAAMGMVKLANRVLNQAKENELNANNAGILFRITEVQVNNLLGQMVICSKNNKIFGFINKSPKYMSLISDSDFDSINEGCKIFNELIQLEQNTNSLLRYFVLAAKVFESHEEKPKMTLDQLATYENGMNVLLEKRVPLPAPTPSIITKLGNRLG